MYLINHLNRNRTAPYYPAFEIIYQTENLLMAFQVAITFPIIRALWRSSIHLNLRLRFILCFIHADLSSVVRLYVMYLQVYGQVGQVETAPMIICSLVREALLTYFCSLLFAIAIDRFIASRYWSWYERGAPSTTLFFATLEILHLLIAYADSWSVIYEHTAEMTFVAHLGLSVIAGAALYYVIYYIDLRELNTLKKGATINSYSVARSYQLKENTNLMKMLSSIATPFVISIIPIFVFYPTYALTRKVTGYDSIRYFSIALYDVWIAIVAIVGIGLFPICEPKIAKHMPKALKNYLPVEKSSSVTMNQVDTDTYFDMLNFDLHKQ